MIDVLDGGGLPELGLAQSCFETAIGAVEMFGIDQQTETFIEVELIDVVIVELGFERVRHANETHVVEFVDRRMF